MAETTWPDPRPTALLVLADGTVIEGFGLGAEGEAVGEVCFNTAMTGYQEILTDPSYAGQIVTFTFPHIGNVGVNDEDIETVNLAAASGVRGCVLKADITDPSNYRATRRFDHWLKARGIIGLAGIDTRALTALIREKGMPNAVIVHRPGGAFDRDALRARREPGRAWSAWTSPRKSPPARATPGTRPRGTWGQGYGRQRRRATTSSPSTMASSATSCASSPTMAAG